MRKEKGDVSDWGSGRLIALLMGLLALLLLSLIIIGSFSEVREVAVVTNQPTGAVAGLTGLAPFTKRKKGSMHILIIIILVGAVAFFLFALTVWGKFEGAAPKAFVETLSNLGSAIYDRTIGGLFG